MGIGTHVVCLRPTHNRAWLMTPVRLAVVDVHRYPLPIRYTSYGEVTDVTSSSPSKTERRGSSLDVYLSSSFTSAMFLRCNVSLCRGMRRVLLTQGNIDGDPCVTDEFDLLHSGSIGPIIVTDGVIPLPTVRTALLFKEMGDLPWNLCVERAPQYWESPRGMSVTLRVAMKDVIGIAPASFADNPFVTVLNRTALRRTLDVVIGVPLAVTVVGTDIAVGTQLQIGCEAGNAGNVSTRLTISTNRGSLLIPSDIVDAPIIAPLCLRRNGTWVTTNVTVVAQRPLAPPAPIVTPTRVTLSDAMSDTVFVPLNSRSDVDLRRMGPPLAPPLILTDGSLVMLSEVCLFSSHGLPLMVVSDGTVSVGKDHTREPSLLRWCVRRRSQVRDGYDTPVFEFTGFWFRVVNVTVSSVALHRSAGIDTKVVARMNDETPLLVPVSIASGSAKRDTVSAAAVVGPYWDSAIRQLDDARVLAFFDLLHVAVGRPCSRPTRLRSTLRPARIITGSFVGGSITVSEVGGDPHNTLVLATLPTHELDATVENPYSLCLSVDGGKFFSSVDVAYIEAVYGVGNYPSDDARSTVEGLEGVALQKYLVSSPANDVAAFAIAVSATGMVSDMGVLVAGLLLLRPLSTKYDGSTLVLTTPSSKVTLPQKLSIYRRRILRLSEQRQVLLNRVEFGRLLSIDGDVSEGMAIRFAPNCSESSYAWQSWVSESSIVVPAIIDGLGAQTLSVCMGDGLARPQSFVTAIPTVEVGANARLSSINGVSSGRLVLWEGHTEPLALAGPAVEGLSVMVRFVNVGSTCNAPLFSAAPATQGRALLPPQSVVTDPMAVCYSIDLGTNYLLIPNLTAVVVPPTTTGWNFGMSFLRDIEFDVTATFNQIVWLSLGPSLPREEGPRWTDVPQRQPVLLTDVRFLVDGMLSNDDGKPILAVLSEKECDGETSGQLHGAFYIDRRTGAVSMPRGLSDSGSFVVCTSSDGGSHFYSANATIYTQLATLSNRRMPVVLKVAPTNVTNIDPSRAVVVLRTASVFSTSKTARVYSMEAFQLSLVGVLNVSANSISIAMKRAQSVDVVVFPLWGSASKLFETMRIASFDLVTSFRAAFGVELLSAVLLSDRGDLMGTYEFVLPVEPPIIRTVEPRDETESPAAPVVVDIIYIMMFGCGIALAAMSAYRRIIGIDEQPRTSRQSSTVV